MNYVAIALCRTGGLVLIGGVFMLVSTGCQRIAADQAVERDKESPPPKAESKGDRFAEDRAPAEGKAVGFDGKRAMTYLKDLCALGPRISGTDGMKLQQIMLQKHFERAGAKVALQKFDGKQPSQKNAVPMVNMIVTWHPEAKRRVIFCGHYDTRPIADQEPAEREWRKPFLSANDGTSTIAFLMEFAHHIKDLPLKVGIDFIIFDGEEFINDNKRDRFFLGSDYFADQYTKNKPEHVYVAGVLLDLFAARDARFLVEQNSLFLAGGLVEQIWKEAERQGVKSFRAEHGPNVQDDHLALNRVDIPTVDIIDMNYTHWHKLSDLPDKCSGDKIAEVAKVLMSWVQRVK